MFLGDQGLPEIFLNAQVHGVQLNQDMLCINLIESEISL